LTKTCDAIGLPTTATKRSPEKSEFVGLVVALMRRLPPRLVAGRSIKAGAVAQAICRARNQPVEIKKKRERAIEREERKARMVKGAPVVEEGVK